MCEGDQVAWKAMAEIDRETLVVGGWVGGGEWLRRVGGRRWKSGGGGVGEGGEGGERARESERERERE